MSIDLEWEVESTAGQQKVGEDPAVLAARQRRSRCWQRGLIAALMLALIGGSIALVRYWQVQRWRHAMLVATAESEMAALRLGDQLSFLKRQVDDDAWRSAQLDMFQEFQALSPEVEIPGEIVALTISGDEAEVTVLQRVNGDAIHVAWLYEYTEQGWRHAPSPPEPWRRPDVVELPGLTVAYAPPDERLAQVAAVVLSGWRVQALALSGLPNLPPLDVSIKPHIYAPEWSDAEQTQLLIPSSVRFQHPPGDIDPSLRAELAELAAIYWAREITGGDNPSDHDAWWIQDEVTRLLHHAFDPVAPPAMMLGPLSEAFSPDLIPVFTAKLRDRQRPDEALRIAMRVAAPGDLSGDALRRYLILFLQAETGLHHRFALPDERIHSIFTDAVVIRDPDNRRTDWLSTAQADPASIRVRSMHLYDGVLWAEVESSMVTDLYIGQTPLTTNSSSLVPFRWADGYWTGAAEVGVTELGALRERQIGQVTVIHREADGLFIGQLMADIDRIYERVSADFDLAEPPDIRVEVSFDPQTNWQPDAPDVIDPQLASPFRAVCVPARSRRECFLDGARLALASEVLDFRLAQAGGEADHPMAQGIVQWESRRLGVAPWRPPAAFAPVFRGDPALLELDYLWMDEAADFANIPEGWQRQVGVEALVEVVVEQYGIGALPRLIDALSHSRSVEEWLQASVGADPAAVEAAWQIEFSRLLNEYAASGDLAWMPVNDFMGEPMDSLAHQH